MGPEWKHWARDGGHSEEICQLAAESIAGGWTLHYLAQDPERGGGLTLPQLRSLARHMRGETPVRKRVDWPRWAARVHADPTDAARSDAWLEFMGAKLLGLAKIRLDSVGRDGKTPSRSPHRLSPRVLLEAHGRRLQPQWEYDVVGLQQKLTDALEQHLKTDSAFELPQPELLSGCLQAALPALHQCAWELLIQRSRQRLADWASRIVLRSAGAPSRPIPLVSCAEIGDRHFAAVAVDENGRCLAERALDLDDAVSAQRDLCELANLASAELALVQLGEGAQSLEQLLDGLEEKPLAWKVVDGVGARRWSSGVHAVTILHQWSLAGREALFLARRFQRPLETLAELPVSEWSPPELARWLEADDWTGVEQELTDLVHERGLELRFAGPKALGRLAAITPLHSQRAAPPPDGWQSLDAFRQSLAVHEQVWQQLEPFLREADPANSGSVDIDASGAVRRQCLRWSDLSTDMQLEGVITRAATFGVFVDLGTENESLLHVSQMANRFLADPLEEVTIGDVVRVVVTTLDEGRRRASLRAVDVQPNRGRGRGQADRTKGEQRARGKPERRGKRKDAKPRASAKKEAKKQTKKPRPERTPAPTPLTKEMAEGKAPLRSFADLVQFYDQKRSEED